jgi:hypothetical protein
VCAVLAVDSLAGLAYHTSTDASIIVTWPRTGTVDEALVVFPGYASIGKAVSDAFRPSLNDNQAMVVVGYAQRGVDDQAIYRQVMDELATLAPRRLRILAGSMGGAVATRFLTRYARSADLHRFGKVVLVLDTAASGPGTAQVPQWIFWVSSWYRGGPVSSAGWALLSGFVAQPMPEPGANQEIIDEGNDGNAWLGLPALTTQADYLGSFRADEIPAIRSAVLRATYLRANPAQADPLIRVDDAIVAWKTGLPDLTVTTIATRQGSWHLPWTYRPRETLAAVNAV